MKKLIVPLIILFSYGAIYSQTSSYNYQPIIYKPELSLIEKESRVNNYNISYKTNSGKKSVGLSVILSLLLPGMGELYAGDYSTGKYLTALEGMLWLTYASVDIYGTWIRDDARNFAVVNGGVTLAGQHDKFFTDIGNYLDVHHYNDRKLQERQANKLYDPNSAFYWQWNSDANRSKYRIMRIKSDEAFNSLQFVLGAVLVNHIVSAVNAARLTSKYNREGVASKDLNIGTQIVGTIDNPHFILKISKTF